MAMGINWTFPGESCCCTPEVNIMLYANYTSIKIHYYRNFRESHIFLIQIVKEPFNGL